MSDWFPPESLPQTGDFDGAEDLSEGSERPLREGLPPTFRMRHDRHYVDELDARSPAALFQMVPTTQIRTPKAVDLEEVRPLVESVRKVGVLQPILLRRRDIGYEVIAGVRRFAAAAAVGLTELPCRIYTVGEQEARALAEADDLRFRVETGRGMRQMQRSDGTLAATLAQISDSLRAATSCWGVATDGPERSHTAAVRGIAQVELQRAIWLTEGLQVLAEEPAAEMHPLLLGSVLDRVLGAMRPECRLSDVALSDNLSRSGVTLRGDERRLALAFGGLIQAVLSLVKPSAPATIRCSVATENDVARIEISETATRPSAILVERFFDPTFHDRPGGNGAAVVLGAAARVIEMHSGRVSVEPTTPRGLRAGITLPIGF
jgi:signal transduction histidine kinase